MRPGRLFRGRGISSSEEAGGSRTARARARALPRASLCTAENKSGGPPMAWNRPDAARRDATSSRTRVAASAHGQPPGERKVYITESSLTVHAGHVTPPASSILSRQIRSAGPAGTPMSYVHVAVIIPFYVTGVRARSIDRPSRALWAFPANSLHGFRSAVRPARLGFRRPAPAEIRLINLTHRTSTRVFSASPFQICIARACARARPFLLPCRGFHATASVSRERFGQLRKRTRVYVCVCVCCARRVYDTADEETTVRIIPDVMLMIINAPYRAADTLPRESPCRVATHFNAFRKCILIRGAKLCWYVVNFREITLYHTYFLRIHFFFFFFHCQTLPDRLPTS